MEIYLHLFAIAVDSEGILENITAPGLKCGTGKKVFVSKAV